LRKERALFKYLIVLSVLILSLTAFEILSRSYLFALDNFRKAPTCSISESFETEGEFFGKYAVMSKMDDDPVLGLLPKPYDTGPVYKINGQSFRYDEDIPEKPGENEIRVFITGGSTAWGAGVSMDQLYSSVAEKYIGELLPDKKVRFISAGIGGSVSTQERYWLESHILNFHPNYVMMFSGWNDSYAAYSGDRKFSDVLARKYNYTYPWKKRPDIGKLYPEISPDDYAFKSLYFIDLFFRNAEVYEIVKSHILDEGIPVETVLKNNEAISKLLKSLGIEFVYVLQPTPFLTRKNLSVCEKDVLKFFASGYQLFPDYNASIYEILRERLPLHAAENHYLYVDADDIIAGTDDGIFFDYVHMGERGNRLVGEEMARLIHDLELAR
jgi:lysophospholipase L1-like esterase